MVTRSVVNYEQHKQDIKILITEKLGEEIATKFINYYSQIYDEHGRSFIDWKLALTLVKEYVDCKRLGTRWYAFVGVGGTGKSTIAKNVFCFLDKSFSITRSTVDMKSFIKVIGEFGEEDKLKAVYMDEPDDSIVPHSEQGKQARKVFGKIRQQHCFLGVCATDLTDIPTYMFRKLSGIFFTPKLGKGMFFRNDPDKQSYILQEIRKNYQYKGYKIFFELQRSAGCTLFDTSKSTPIDYQEKEYLKIKRKDYEDNIKDFLNQSTTKINERDKIILRMRDNGKTQEQIAIDVGMHRTNVGKILKKYENENERE